MTHMNGLSILVLDDEKRVRDEICEFLRKNENSVFEASNPSEAFGLIESEHIDIAIVDIKLPQMSGLEVLKLIKDSYHQLEVIMISGHGDMNSVIEAMRLGAIDFFPKPFRLSEITLAVQRSKRFIDLNRQLELVSSGAQLLSDKLHAGFGNSMIGESSHMKHIIELMHRVAKTDHTSVLITGESGTGKELVAHGIHKLSKRNKYLFHSVNCSAISDSLFESEFFGHRRGSFTGSIEDRQGWFEAANKGTLFMDEIGDMPLSQQAKILRVLEDRKISPVGSQKSIEVDVRVIAASNQALEKMADEKRFRIDLYHRLSTFIIHLPPLRERKEDIPLIYKHFINHYSEVMGKRITRISKDAEEMLLNYSYPGNIRELRNMIERALILCDRSELLPQHFPGIAVRKGSLLRKGVDEIMDLEVVEQRLILKALEKSDNNKSKAAAMLNISWQSLDRRMKKFRIG